MHYGLYSLLQDWTGLDFKTIMDEAESIRNTVCSWTCTIFLCCFCFICEILS